MVELPIQRERHTDRQLFKGSGIGRARAQAREQTVHRIRGYWRVFGPEADRHRARSGTRVDARLLLFPCAPLRGVFAWATAPLILGGCGAI